MNVPKNVTHRENQFGLPGPDHFVKVDDDEYLANVIGVVGAKLVIGPRVVIWFRLEYGQRIAAYYKVNELSKNGKDVKGRTHSPEFVAGWKSRIARDIATLFPERYSPTSLPVEVPRIPEPVRIVTRTVTRDMSKRARPESFASSVVDQIVGWASECNTDISTDLHLDNHTNTGTNSDTSTYPYTLSEYDEWAPRDE